MGLADRGGEGKRERGEKERRRGKRREKVGRGEGEEGGTESGSTTVMKGGGSGHFFGHRLVPLCRLK